MGSCNRIARIVRLASTVVLTAPLLASCGIDTEGFAPIECSPRGGPLLLAGVVSKEPSTYLELRQVQDGFGGPSRLIESVGSICDGAMDVALCAAIIAEMKPETGFPLGSCSSLCPQHVIIANEADAIEVIDSRAELEQWLGPIDTPADAILLAAASGYQMACNSPDKGGVRKTATGYELLVLKITSFCDPVERSLLILSVDFSGNIEELEKEVLESENQCLG